MLRSVLTAVRTAALHPEHCNQLSPCQYSRLLGTNFRFYTAHSSPDANSSQDQTSTQQKTAEPEKNAEDLTKKTQGSEHDHLLKEKDALLQDLQVWGSQVNF